MSNCDKNAARVNFAKNEPHKNVSTLRTYFGSSLSYVCTTVGNLRLKDRFNLVSTKEAVEQNRQ